MSQTEAQLELFHTRYAALNAEQREAVDALDGPVMVIAGPGTGKTTVLTLRIANILREAKTKPERILALTFTESGAAAIRRNLMDLIGEQAYRVEISTFHGFANRIIGDYPDHFPEVIGGSSITEIDQVSMLQKLLDAMGDLKTLRPFGDRYYYLKNILAAINELKRQGVTPEHFAQIAADEKKSFYENPDLYNESGKFEGKMKTKYATPAKHVEKNLELATVYVAYQKELRSRKQYDYSDMIMQVAEALEKDEHLARVLSDSYDYFLVDEHQDTNDAQNKIIEMLAGEKRNEKREKEGDSLLTSHFSFLPNLFVVGDEKQAIFRFQGASLENFLYFKNKYKNVKLITLKNNYRSTQAILDAAQSVSPRETQLIAKAGHVESPAHLAVLSSPDAEYYFIAERIREIAEENKALPSQQLRKQGLEDVAVLYRDNRDVIPLARMLEKQGIPFVIESDQDVLGDPSIKKLVRILRAVEHFGSDVWLIEALHVDFLNVPAIDIYKLAAFAKREHKKIYDVIRQEGFLEMAGVKNKSACLKFFENLSNWKRAAKNKSAVEAFEMIVRDSGFLEAALNGVAATETIAKLHVLFDLLKTFMEHRRNYTLDDFFTYLNLMEEHGVSLKGRDVARAPGRVRLMTAHKSKGLEFAYVFIMNAVDRKWGSRNHKESIKLPEEIYGVLVASMRKKKDGKRGSSASAEDDGKEENAAVAIADDDERNIFYVALTRAKKEIFITMVAADRDGKEQLPTQFISEMKSELLEPLDVSKYEKDFADHRTEIEFKPTPAKLPELKDKKFLNELFDEQGLSVTAINNYLECPWHYFYVNLVRIPEAPNKHLAFGNAVHAAFKNYFDAFDEGDDRGKEYLVRQFESALFHEPIKESEYEEALEKGRRTLPAFYEKYHDTWTRHALNELHIDGVESGGVKIKGNLDRIEFLSSLSSSAKADDPRFQSIASNIKERLMNGSTDPPPARGMTKGTGSHDSVRVIDYKTGKPKSRNEVEGKTKDADGNYFRQLVFYKLLLDKEGRHDMQEGVLQFIEPDDRGTFHREAFAITSADVAALETEVARIANEIKDLAFWNAGCHEPDCKYCELRKGM